MTANAQPSVVLFYASFLYSLVYDKSLHRHNNRCDAGFYNRRWLASILLGELL